MAETPAERPVEPEDARILVVEDNPGNFALIARLLAFTGVQSVEWKTTGWGVVEFAQRMGQLDLILMDLRLPHEDGYQVLQELRSHSELANTRVVVVTALGSPAEMARARDAGFDGFIAKPIDVGQFPDQIRSALRGEPVWVADV